MFEDPPSEHTIASPCRKKESVLRCFTRANKPKALSTSIKRRARTKKVRARACSFVGDKTPPCPPVASHKLTLVVPGESQPVAFCHFRDTFWQKRQEGTRSVARAPTGVASTPSSVARVTTSALRAPSSASSAKSRRARAVGMRPSDCRRSPAHRTLAPTFWGAKPITRVMAGTKPPRPPKPTSRPPTRPAGTSPRTSQPAPYIAPLPKHQGEQGHRFNARRQHERLSAPERHALTILVRAAVASLIKER